MKIKNKKISGIICIAVGIFFSIYFCKLILTYFNIASTGIKTNASIIGYKRYNNNSNSLHPAFTFTTTNGESITTLCKTSLPKFLNNNRLRYFKNKEVVEIAYLPNNASTAVIINYTSWCCYVFYLLFTLLFVFLGYKMLFKK